MENILGPFYKWWFIITYYFKLRTTYRVDNFLFALGNVITLVGTVLTWFVASGAEFDVPFKNQLTYYIIGTFFYSFINMWPSYYGFIIKRGNHSSILLTPTGFFQYVYSQYLGMALFQNANVIFIILLTSPLWFTYIQPPSSLVSILLLIALIPVAAVIMFMLEMLVALAAFFITEVNGLTLNYGFASSIFSGRLFPLGLLIPVFWVHLFNPFAYLFYHPMQIYLGNYSNLESLQVITVGAISSLLLYFIGRQVFQFGLRKNESVGL